VSLWADAGGVRGSRMSNRTEKAQHPLLSCLYRIPPSQHRQPCKPIRKHACLSSQPLCRRCRRSLFGTLKGGWVGDVENDNGGGGPPVVHGCQAVVPLLPRGVPAGGEWKAQ
jgi:hypothetical protein